MSFVEVSGLEKSYGKVKAVSGLSFSVEKGEIYALVGPDGAGKSSVIRSMCNLIATDAGTIRVGTLDVASRFNEVKLLLGYMPQIFSLYPDLTVEENLIFYAGIYGITGSRFAQKAETLYRFSNLKPFKNRRASALSGGMKQKLALSCALMHDPELLLLDEPTTGVDPLSRRQFWEILLELKDRGVTIIVSTPYMDEIARADRAGFMFGGKKIGEGVPKELPRLFNGAKYYLDQKPDQSLIESINAFEGLSSRRFGSGLVVYAPSEQTLTSLTRELHQAGLRVDMLKRVEADLEDVFIQLMEPRV